jgi:hypothetical protein
MDVLSSEDEALVDAAIAARGANDGERSAALRKRRFGSGARSTHAALAIGATLVAMTMAPTVVVTSR